MARAGWPQRNRAARSFRQVRRFHHVINSDMVFGTHRVARLGINHDRIETRADTSSLLNNCAPELSIGGCISVSLFHDGTFRVVSNHKVAGPFPLRALFIHGAMFDLSPLIAPRRTWIIRRRPIGQQVAPPILAVSTLILPRAPHIQLMAQWQRSITRQPPKTQPELRPMLSQAVRNTQTTADQGPKRLLKAKKIAAAAASVD